MPNLPGAEDEPYDRRFAKWMIKNKVGRGSCRAGRCPTFAWLLLQGSLHSLFFTCTRQPCWFQELLPSLSLAVSPIP